MKWAKTKTSFEYDYLNFLGITNPGYPHFVICSEFVWQAYMSQGIDIAYHHPYGPYEVNENGNPLYPEDIVEIVTPQDLADSPEVVNIGVWAGGLGVFDNWLFNQ